MIGSVFASAFCATLAVLLPAPANAWGFEGHAIIADIAEARLTPSAARRVAEILQGARMRDVSFYADEIRPFRRETARWHFINIEPGATDYLPERDCRQIEGQGDCIIAAIARNIQDLKSSGERQQLGLKFLIHFIGDLHQPFHAVAEARGGNDIKVTFLGAASNLHKVWDSDLVRRAKRSTAEYVRILETEQIKGRETTALEAGSTIDWALQSRAVGLRAMVGQNESLDERYATEFIPVMEVQLVLAGIRLAAVLNEAFPD